MVKRIVRDDGVPLVYVNWIFKFAKKNYWKVAGLIDFDDLIQEGYYAFYYCKRRYGDIDPPHLMKMLQIAYYQTIVDYAKKRTGLAEYHPEDNRIEGLDPWERILQDDFYQEIQLKIAEAPELIRNFLSLFLSDDTLSELQKPYKKERNGVRETTNERICRLLGIEKTDVVSQLKEYFHEDCY